MPDNKLYLGNKLIMFLSVRNRILYKNLKGMALSNIQKQDETWIKSGTENLRMFLNEN